MKHKIIYKLGGERLEIITNNLKSSENHLKNTGAKIIRIVKQRD